MKSNLITPILAAFTLIVGSAAAQDEPKVSLRLDIVAWGDSIEGLSLGSEASKKITAQAFTYSEPVKYAGPALLHLHHDGSISKDIERGPVDPEDERQRGIPLVPTSEPGDKNLPTIPPKLAKLREKDASLVALIPLPVGSKRATVLLAPAAEGTFQAYVIDDDPSKLPTGKLRVHNLSPFPIAMEFGDGKKTEIKRGRYTLASAINGSTAYKLAYQHDGQWEIQENNIVPVADTEQTQMIILKSNNSFFLSSSGAAGGFLQTVLLRRLPAKVD